jgi:hypothetical protein
MNEQIEILFKQAGGYVEVDNEGNYFTYTQDFNPEKFSSLIIRECLSNLYLNGYDDAMVQIQKHFGIES